MRWQTSAERGDLGTRESPSQEIGIILVTERVQFFGYKIVKHYTTPSMNRFCSLSNSLQFRLKIKIAIKYTSGYITGQSIRL